MDVYEAIYSRRDVRKFRRDPVDPAIVLRILDAAHNAGSVGFMQPWNFLTIRAAATKEAVYQHFATENARAAAAYSGERRELYDSLKLEGIREAPYNIAVTCDRGRGGTHVLGRSSIYDTDVYSTCCAVQNLWLAARAEGIGVGWVSIFEQEAVKALLSIPPEIILVAYLCLGYPEEGFAEKPLLETVGWRPRLDIQDLIFEERWPPPAKTK